MTDQQMPDHERRYDDALVRRRRRETAVTSDDPEDSRANGHRELDCPDEIDRHTFCLISTTDREHEDAISCAKARAHEPCCENPFPTFVVDSGCQLGHVVCWRVRLEAADLSEVVHRMTGVTGRAPDAKNEESPPTGTYLGETEGDSLDRIAIERGQDLARIA